MNYWFYIIENVSNADPLYKGLTTRILRIPDDVIVSKIKEGDGPYQTIRGLKRNSRIFQNFRKKGSKQVERLLNEKNFVKVKDLVLTPANRGYSKEFIRLIDHTIGGQIKDQNVYGMHYYDPDRVRIIENVCVENSQGVWAAKIEVLNYDSKQWVQKEKITTFFPKNWTMNQLFHECDYAYENKQKVDQKTNVYSSQTLSGVPVEIIIENNEIKTIYPLID